MLTILDPAYHILSEKMSEGFTLTRPAMTGHLMANGFGDYPECFTIVRQFCKLAKHLGDIENAEGNPCLWKCVDAETDTDSLRR